ncbi:MAG TPA: hypothetical protein VH092_24600 [Urbifossiella sp.]|nr:hypothetical protein [Urbifossiella sp.]
MNDPSRVRVAGRTPVGPPTLPTVVPVAAVPSAAPSPSGPSTRSSPSDTRVGPAYVFAAARTATPAPDLTSPPDPPTTPATATPTGADDSASRVRVCPFRSTAPPRVRVPAVATTPWSARSRTPRATAASPPVDCTSPDSPIELPDRVYPGPASTSDPNPVPAG